MFRIGSLTPVGQQVTQLQEGKTVHMFTAMLLPTDGNWVKTRITARLNEHRQFIYSDGEVEFTDMDTLKAIISNSRPNCDCQFINSNLSVIPRCSEINATQCYQRDTPSIDKDQYVLHGVDPGPLWDDLMTNYGVICFLSFAGESTEQFRQRMDKTIIDALRQ